MTRILAPLPDIALIGYLFEAGADILYTGLRNRSREAIATAPDVEDLMAYGRENPGMAEKIHVALNIVPDPGEWKEILSSIDFLLSWGYRNFIVNEHGILRELSRRFPGAAFCGSVGLCVANPSDVLFLEHLGASAVVLPLSSTPQDVRAVKDVSPVTLEVFAICRGEPVTQGKCMLAGYFHAKKTTGGETMLQSSKKTGLCYTVCRTIIGKYPEHDITPRIGEWVEAGVDVFKIEGRYRKPDEISSMVKKVREALGRA